ncbi:DUF378 domain-containing protein [Candidatus Pacearchaeota archaeon]|nr:DUF378 domain-containing protein [Candidatus Pacearchaeota archaeon]
MAKLGAIGWIATILVFIGAINWALYAFGTNLVSSVAGEGTAAKVIYVLVALSGLYILITAFGKK